MSAICVESIVDFPGSDFYYGSVISLSSDGKTALVRCRTYKQGFDPRKKTEERLPCPFCGSFLRSKNIATGDIDCGGCFQKLTQVEEKEFPVESLKTAPWFSV